MYINRFKRQNFAPAAPFFVFVEYHKREIRIQEDAPPFRRAPQAKILHIESDKTDVLHYKMGAAGDFLGVRTLKLGFTLENERPRQDFLVPQPIFPDLRIWSRENEGGQLA